VGRIWLDSAQMDRNVKQLSESSPSHFYPAVRHLLLVIVYFRSWELKELLPASVTMALVVTMGRLTYYIPMLEKDSLTYSPKPDRPDPSLYINPPTPDPTRAGPPPALPAGYGRWREYVYDPNARVIPGAAWAEGGSLAGWRSGGILSVNARDRGGGGGGGNVGRGGGGGGGGGFTKDLSSILCFVRFLIPFS